MIESVPGVYPERRYSLEEIEELITHDYNPAPEISYLKIITQGQDLNIDFDNV